MLDQKTRALQKRMNAWVKSIEPVIGPILAAGRARNLLNEKLAEASKVSKNGATVRRLRKALKELEVAEKAIRNF